MWKLPRLCLIFVLCFTIAPPTLAQTIYRLPEVKFFEDLHKTEEAPYSSEEIKEAKEKPVFMESIWAEPIKGPDGRMYIYIPPKAVLDFIEDPTEENARKYLAWNRERLLKYSRAAEVLRKVAEEEKFIPAERVEEVEKAEKEFAPKKPLVLYFMKEGCNYCAAQSPIVEKWAEKHKDEVDVRGVMVDGEPPRLSFPCTSDVGESQLYGITIYPTIIFFMPSGNNIGIKGFTSLEKIEETYKRGKEGKGVE